MKPTGYILLHSHVFTAGSSRVWTSESLTMNVEERVSVMLLLADNETQMTLFHYIIQSNIMLAVFYVVVGCCALTNKQ